MGVLPGHDHLYGEQGVKNLRLKTATLHLMSPRRVHISSSTRPLI